MNMQDVESSNIAKVGYDSQRKLLAIQFKNGSTRHYKDVPHETYDELLKAESVGRYFHRHIRPRFHLES